MSPALIAARHRTLSIERHLWYHHYVEMLRGYL